MEAKKRTVRACVYECVRKWIIDACVRMMPFFCVSYLSLAFVNLKISTSQKCQVSLKNFLELLAVQNLCQNIMRLHNLRILAEQPMHKRRRRCRFSDGAVHGASIAIFF